MGAEEERMGWQERRSTGTRIHGRVEERGVSVGGGRAWMAWEEEERGERS